MIRALRSRESRGSRAATIAAVAAAGALALFAGAARGQEPVRLTAEEVVRRALASSPELAQVEQEVARRSASVTEARSLLDQSLFADLRVDYTVEELVGSRLKAEVDRRLRLEIPPPEFDKAAAILRQSLPTDLRLNDISACFSAATVFIVRESSTVLCLDADGQPIGLLDGSVPLTPTLFSSADLAEAFAGVEGLDQRIQEFADLLRAAAADTMRGIADVLEGTAAELRRQRRNIGDLPQDREIILLDSGIDYRIPFRNGAALIPSLALASSEDNFIDKPLDPEFGDSFVANQFRVVGGIALEIPLGRGGGNSYIAPLVAAEQAEAAAIALYHHAAAEQAAIALEAYWDVVAATRRLRLLETSLAQQDRLLGATQELVDGGVLPRLDIELNRAQRAATETSVAGARSTLDSARAELARAIGAEASEIAGFEVDLEVGPLLDAAGAALDAEALVSRAFDGRDDVEAARHRIEAESTLAAAAEHDLKPQIDLRLNASYNAYHESFDTRFYQPEGFGDAFGEPWSGPSYGIALRFRLPIGNNGARGRLVQARAATTSSEIDSVELRRSIRLSVLEQLATLGEARSELEARRETRRRIEETAEATMTRYRAGDMTVLDTLVTEQELTRAGLELVGTEREVLSRLTQLRFETGRLVEVPAEGDVHAARLLPLDSPML